MKELLELLSKENEELEKQLYEARTELDEQHTAKWEEIRDMKISWSSERDMLAKEIHKLNIKVAERELRIKQLLDWVYKNKSESWSLD